MSEDYEQLPLYDDFHPLEVFPEDEEPPELEDRIRLMHERIDRLDHLVGMLFESACDDMSRRLVKAVQRSRSRTRRLPGDER